MSEYRKAFIEAHEKFQAEQDKQPVTILQGSDLRYEDGRFLWRGGVIMRMTYGIYRKIFRERE